MERVAVGGEAGGGGGALSPSSEAESSARRVGTLKKMGILSGAKMKKMDARWTTNKQ